jgi:Phosphotransferase enzyme family
VQATAAQLAAVYGALSTASPGPRTAPMVVLVGTGVPATVAEQLHRFGVDIHSAASPELSTAGRGAFVLGGPAHGTFVPAGPGADVDGAELSAVVERARLQDWAGAAGVEPTVTTLHTPGSDSRGVVQFRHDGTELVAKIGAADAIAAEAAFAVEVNALLAEHGHRDLFPRVYGLRREGDQAVSIMAAGRPLPVASLFADDRRTVLADDAPEQLQPHLDRLAVWYGLTARTGRPIVADYLYRERYHLLREHPTFLATFAALFGGRRPDDVLGVPVELPGGTVPGWDEAVAWLDEVAADLMPDSGCAVHGDIYAANMLLLDDGSPVLIDPRLRWEGRDRPDVGYGDPVYDLATMLHGVLPMAAVLRAVETGTAAGLFDARPGARDGRLDLSSLRLPIAFEPPTTALVARMLRTLPPTGEDLRRIRTRLYVGAATSLAGWLKYEKSLRTPDAWLATLGYVTWYLAAARMSWEGHDPIGDLP